MEQTNLSRRVGRSNRKIDRFTNTNSTNFQTEDDRYDDSRSSAGTPRGRECDHVKLRASISGTHRGWTREVRSLKGSRLSDQGRMTTRSLSARPTDGTPEKMRSCAGGDPIGPLGPPSYYSPIVCAHPLVLREDLCGGSHLLARPRRFFSPHPLY